MTQTATETTPPTLRSREASLYLSMSESWLDQAARRGVVPSIKLGRVRVFLKEDLDKFLAERRGK